MIQGLDVSNYQGVISWPKVKAAGYEFTFVKALTVTPRFSGSDCMNRSEVNSEGGGDHF